MYELVGGGVAQRLQARRGGELVGVLGRQDRRAHDVEASETDVRRQVRPEDEEHVIHAQQRRRGQHRSPQAEEPARGEQLDRHLKELQLGRHVGQPLVQQLAEHPAVDERAEHVVVEVVGQVPLDDDGEQPEGILLGEDAQ